MRTAELVGLRWGKVDVRRSRLRVDVSRTLGEDNAPKTENSTRRIRLLPEVVAVLRDAKSVHATDATFVFTTQVGTPLDEDRFVEKHWHRAMRAMEIRPRKFYATRHTFITAAVERGANIKRLAEYVGTSLAMIEKHYAAKATEEQQDAMLEVIAGRSTAKHVGAVA